jgi:peptidoglycan hydrolase-like protein with peptidoglycan-binding domain
MTKVLAATLAAGLALALVPSSRAAVEQAAGLQVALRAWGLYEGPIDAIPGPGTRSAVRAFQRQEGLPVDGIAGRRTRIALGPLGRPLRARSVLARGAFGWDVSVLQFALARAGMYRWPIDGYFGAETASALRRFQRERGLAADGVAGPQTLSRLDRSAPVQRPRTTPVAYVVRPGDTLTAIAGRLGTTMPALARANRIDPSSLLLIGTKLRLPQTAGTKTSPSAVRELVDAWSGRLGVDPALARALAWMESGYQANLTSDAGAWGVMQIIPSSWDYVEQVVLGKNVPRTTGGNVRVGVVLLRQLLREFGGDERLALGAWYQGAQAVRDHGLYPETKLFVADVLALRRRV